MEKYLQYMRDRVNVFDIQKKKPFKLNNKDKLQLKKTKQNKDHE